MSKEIFDQMQGDTTLKGKALKALSQYNEGSVSFAELVLGAAVVDQETFTLGNDTYEIHQINTDTGANVSGAMDIKTNKVPTNVAHNVAAGAVIRIENEYMLVLEVASTTELVVLRGAYGSTAATHADTTDIFEAAQAVGAGNMAIPVGATLTGAAVEPLIIAAVDAWVAGFITALGGSNGLKHVASFPVSTQAHGSADGVYFMAAGAAGLACSETFANAAITLPAAFGAEVEVGTARQSKLVHTVVAGDVTAGFVKKAFPFTPSVVDVSIKESNVSTGFKTFDGAVVIDGQIVTIDNSGTSDWAAADVMIINAYE